MKQFDTILFIAIMVVVILCGAATIQAMADFSKLDKVEIVRDLQHLHE